ncbi:MAG: hypothetical protein R2845_13390 [Thermomicrobiales bacterium]
MDRDSGALGAGAIIGLIFGTIGAWLTGVLDRGATFYAGAAGCSATRFAEAEGSPPIGWVLLGGVVIPAIVVIACAIAPVFMRVAVLRNEIMDGVVTLGAAAGSGYAAATAVVLAGDRAWPEPWRERCFGLDRDARRHDGAASADLWRAFRRTLRVDLAIRHRSASIVTDARRGGGVGGIVVFSVVDLLIQPAGATAELVWQLVVVVALWFVTRSAIRSALRHDALIFHAAVAG